MPAIPGSFRSDRGRVGRDRERRSGRAVGRRLQRRDEKLNEQLIPIYDPTRRLFLASEDSSPVDPEQQWQTLNINLKYGIVTINEARDAQGFAQRQEHRLAPNQDALRRRQGSRKTRLQGRHARHRMRKGNIENDSSVIRPPNNGRAAAGIPIALIGQAKNRVRFVARRGCVSVCATNRRNSLCLKGYLAANSLHACRRPNSGTRMRVLCLLTFAQEEVISF